MNLNEFFEDLFNTRFTAKGYDPERKVSDRDWQTILHAGRMSPSSVGMEPWEFVRLTDRDVIDAIVPFTWGGKDKFVGASHILLLLVRHPNDLRIGSDYMNHILRDVKLMNAEEAATRAGAIRSFLENDLGATTDEQIQSWATRQVYIALANMLTTAAALGVDSTPIEGFNVAQVNRILGKLNVIDPKHFSVAVMACFGYANIPALPKSRRPLDEVYREF